jgi:hypothetical protein
MLQHRTTGKKTSMTPNRTLNAEQSLENSIDLIRGAILRPPHGTNNTVVSIKNEKPVSVFMDERP